MNVNFPWKSILFIFLLAICIGVAPASGTAGAPQSNTTVTPISPVLRGELCSFTTTIPDVSPHDVRIWVLGRKYMTIDTVRVKNDSRIIFSFDTNNISQGQYYILIQVPETDHNFDITIDNQSGKISNRKKAAGYQEIFTFDEARNMDDNDSFNVLFREFTSPGVRDKVLIYSVDIIEPYVSINPVGDHAIGELVSITGTTNYPVNTMLWISAGPRTFTNFPPHYFDSQVRVLPGQSGNEWSVIVNTSAFTIDEYTVRVQTVNKYSRTSQARFNITQQRSSSSQTTIVPLTSMAEWTVPIDYPSQPSQKETVNNGSSIPITRASTPVMIPVGTLGILVILAGIFQTRH